MRVCVSIAHNNVLLPALRAGDVEIIVSGIPPRRYEDLVQAPLCEDPFAVFCAPDHPLRRRHRVRIADLVAYRWAASATDVLAWQWLMGAFANQGLPAPQTALEAASFPIRAHITAATNLLCFNSRAGFAVSALGEHLAELQVKGLKWSREIGISYRKEAYQSPAVRRFVRLLQEGARRQTWQA